MKKILLVFILLFILKPVFAFDIKNINFFKKKMPEMKAKMPETKQQWLMDATDIPLKERIIETKEKPKSNKKFYYPEDKYIFDKYNYPSGKRELNIDDIKKNLYSYPYIVADNNLKYVAYPRYYFYPETNQISSEFYVEKLDLSKSKIKRILEYNHNQEERYPVVQAGMKERYKNLFNGLTLVDWSNDGKKVLIKEKVGSTINGIYKTYLYVHFIKDNIEDSYTIKLTNFDKVIKNYYLNYEDKQLIKYQYDIMPLGFSLDNDNIIICLCYIYNKEGEKLFIGAWGYDLRNDKTMLISKTETDFSISTNGVILKRTLD